MPPKPHPAKFTHIILEKIRPYLRDGQRVLDPFAGTGQLRHIAPNAILNEIEPEWAIQCRDNAVIGNALHLPFGNDVFDAIVTSPCYGNRMADHHKAKDESKRITYTHTLGRELHHDNAGTLRWGEAYRTFHRNAWTECDRVLKPGGLFVLNVSDHIRKGVVMPVSDWHYSVLCSMKYFTVDVLRVRTPRMRNGRNRELRVEYEYIFVMEKNLGFQ